MTASAPATVRRALRERARVIAAFAALELALAALLGVGAARGVAAPLARHPDGTGALFHDGGRVAIDLFVQRQRALDAAAVLVLAGVVAYAAVTLVFGAALPRALGAPTRLGLLTALRDAARRTPTLLALCAIALSGYALAALLGWLMVQSTLAATARWPDARAADLWTLGAALPAALVAYGVHVWHDLARAHAVLDARFTALDAAGGAARRVVGAPLATLGARALALGASGALLGLEALAGGGIGVPRGGVALAALVALQLALAGARVAVRAAWLAHATRAWRAISPQEFRGETRMSNDA